MCIPGTNIVLKVNYTSEKNKEKNKILMLYLFVVVQSCPALCDPMNGSMPGFPILHHLLGLLTLMSIESVTPSNHLILCCPLLLLLWFFPSITAYSSELALRIRWANYWNFSFSTCLSSEYSGLISFRKDCFDVLAVQGTLKSLLQHHSLKALILWC